MVYYDGNEVFDEEQLCKMITSSIKYYKDKCEQLQEENLKLRQDAIKIVREEYLDEIYRLGNELVLSYGQFSSLKEKKAYEEFEKKHMHDRLTSKYNGGRGPYLIPTGTGIGTILKVKCPICGEEEDITDTEVW